LGHIHARRLKRLNIAVLQASSRINAHQNFPFTYIRKNAYTCNQAERRAVKKEDREERGERKRGWS